jgi:nicotinamidase/pyrazinamidase
MTQYGGRTALIVTDVQNDFADPQGSLYVAGGEHVAAAANREIDQAVAAGALVVYTQDWHPQSTPHFKKDGGIWPVHCVQETWGAAFHPDLKVVPAAQVVRKGTAGEDGYSGFSVRDPRTGATGPTRLESLLRGRRIEELVVIGLATDYCVKETALDAARLGFAVTVLPDAVRAVDLKPGDGERALAAVRAAGAHVE